MWKPNWAAKPPTEIGLLVFCLCLVAAACASAPAATVAPTLTLIPPTLTYTPSPVTPTATIQALPGPSDISATLNSDPTPFPANTVTGNMLDTDPVAAELVALAQRRLGQELGLPMRRLQVEDVRAITWTDASLGCPAPDQTYEAVEIDGYRIVLSAGDREYLFHTDFDRVMPCDPANERLPEATAEATSEP